jgi:hypothetical protein
MTSAGMFITAIIGSVLLAIKVAYGRRFLMAKANQHGFPEKTSEGE